MSLISALALTLTLALSTTPASAHMQLHHPAPFNSTNNPHRTTPPDPYLQYPYDCCGVGARWTFPCRGYTSLLHHPNLPDGLPTATWQAGSTQTFTLTGIGNHWGGSCQAGFSDDGARTFKVATSYEGNCPHRHAGLGPEGQGFEVRVPEDLGEGVRVFAWSWYNREQEFNMNCATVNITAPPPPSSRPNILPRVRGRRAPTGTASLPFASRPGMFLADTRNGCLTPKTTAEVKFPRPGPDVVMGDGLYPLQLPSGDCGGRV